VVVLAGCASNGGRETGAYVEPLPGNSRIVMMPPDIRYYLMTAGGNPELHPTWTADAESEFATAIAGLAGIRGIDIQVLKREDVGDEIAQYEGLHAAVGEAIIEHSLEGARLPSKEDNAVSQWTLGPGVEVIQEATGADYALFVHYRENQASGGRIAFAILAAAAKVVIPTSSEHGFASLVDLRTGDVSWFAILYDDGYEIREQTGAEIVANWLLQELPVAGSFAGALEAE
jgi:hypothetical protein